MLLLITAPATVPPVVDRCCINNRIRGSDS